MLKQLMVSKNFNRFESRMYFVFVVHWFLFAWHLNIFEAKALQDRHWPSYDCSEECHFTEDSLSCSHQSDESLPCNFALNSYFVTNGTKRNKNEFINLVELENNVSASNEKQDNSMTSKFPEYLPADPALSLSDENSFEGRLSKLKLKKEYAIHLKNYTDPPLTTTTTITAAHSETATVTTSSTNSVSTTMKPKRKGLRKWNRGKGSQKQKNYTKHPNKPYSEAKLPNREETVINKIVNVTCPSTKYEGMHDDTGLDMFSKHNKSLLEHSTSSTVLVQMESAPRTPPSSEPISSDTFAYNYYAMPKEDCIQIRPHPGRKYSTLFKSINFDQPVSLQPAPRKPSRRIISRKNGKSNDCDNISNLHPEAPETIHLRRVVKAKQQHRGREYTTPRTHSFKVIRPFEQNTSTNDQSIDPKYSGPRDNNDFDNESGESGDCHNQSRLHGSSESTLKWLKNHDLCKRLLQFP